MVLICAWGACCGLKATVRQAFDFCARFKRNHEFRNLCEMLRQHIQLVGKYQGVSSTALRLPSSLLPTAPSVVAQQTNALDLKHPETQRLFLETRFEQLKLASDLELWQEA